MPIEEGEQIDIVKEWNRLKELEKEEQNVMKKLEQYICEIIQAVGDIGVSKHDLS
jgi:type I restriction-modification system DNA methylase subunit